jgi:hypothetical protein
MLHDALEGFQKWIIRADYLPDNPMDTPRIKFTETIKSSRQIIDPRCKFVSCGVKGLPSTINKAKHRLNRLGVR